MPWKVTWHDEDERVLVVTPVDPWTWDEFKDVMDTAQGLTQGKPYTVDLVYHLGNDLTLPKLPPGEHVAPWVPLRDVLVEQPDNRGKVIIVAAPLFIESILRTLKSVVRDQQNTSNIELVETWHEAETTLAARGPDAGV